MKIKYLRNFAAVSGFLAVALGAFAAHGLKSQLSQYGADIWQTAVFYQFIHTLLLFAVVTNDKLVQKCHEGVVRIGLMLSSGIVIFSGSLYVVALTGISKLGMITPIGGTLFLISWLYLIKLFNTADENKQD